VDTARHYLHRLKHQVGSHLPRPNAPAVGKICARCLLRGSRVGTRTLAVREARTPLDRFTNPFGTGSGIRGIGYLPCPGPGAVGSRPVARSAKAGETRHRVRSRTIPVHFGAVGIGSSAGELSAAPAPGESCPGHAGYEFLLF
jgi:hypothetical protein